MCPCLGCEQQPDRDCLVGSGMVPSRFGDESNKAGGGGECDRSIVWLGSSVVECSHGKRETLGSSPGRAAFFFRPCDIKLTDTVAWRNQGRKKCKWYYSFTAKMHQLYIGVPDEQHLKKGFLQRLIGWNPLSRRKNGNATKTPVKSHYELKTPIESSDQAS